jgi:hypothetical protein
MATSDDRVYWVCPKCDGVIAEGDVPYYEAVCRREVRCRHAGGTVMRPVRGMYGSRV